MPPLSILPSPGKYLMSSICWRNVASILVLVAESPQILSWVFTCQDFSFLSFNRLERALFKKRLGVASYENPAQEEGKLDDPTHLYNPSQRSQCNQWTKPQNQSRMLDFSFSPHICIQQNLKKTAPKSLLNNLAWNVYPLTKKHRITRKYKVLKPFPEATVAYTVYLF